MSTKRYFLGRAAFVLQLLFITAIAWGQGIGFHPPVTQDHWEMSYEFVGHSYGNHWVINQWGVPESIPFDYDWNGPLQIGGASNSTYLPLSVSMTSEGYVKIKFDWIGNSPPPGRLLVNISSNAGASWGPSGSGNAVNGLGSPSVLSPEWPNTLECYGTKMRVLDGRSGHAEIKIDCSATATGSGLNSRAFADAGNVSAAILIRGLELYPTNYYLNYRRTLNGETVYSRGAHILRRFQI